MAALFLWLVISRSSPFAMGAFGIVLTRDGTTVVNDADIANYNATSHALILTSDSAERIRVMKAYLEGPFIIFMSGEEVLSGIFVPPITSRSYSSSQVVITYPTFDSNYRVMRIQMGYPWDEPVSPDPRNDHRIIQYFEATGKLIH
jgi:hypothetical protein